MIRIIAAALTDRAALIERLGVRGVSAEQSRLMLDRAASLAKTLLQGSPGARATLARDIIEQVTIGQSEIGIALRKRLLVVATGAARETSPDDMMLLSAPAAFRRRGVETKLVLPAAVQMDKPGRIDAALLKTVARPASGSNSWRPGRHPRFRPSPIVRVCRSAMSAGCCRWRSSPPTSSRGSCRVTSPRTSARHGSRMNSICRSDGRSSASCWGPDRLRRTLVLTPKPNQPRAEQRITPLLGSAPKSLRVSGAVHQPTRGGKRRICGVTRSIPGRD